MRGKGWAEEKLQDALEVYVRLIMSGLAPLSHEVHFWARILSEFRSFSLCVSSRTFFPTLRTSVRQIVVSSSEAQMKSMKTSQRRV